MTEKATKPNVFIFILDTLQISVLNGVCNSKAPENFLEKVLQRGTLFANYIVAGGTTRVSVNSLFNGFYGETSRLNYQNCVKEFSSNKALSLTEVFKYHGYQTLAVTQGDVSVQPAGFDQLWERQDFFDLEKLSELITHSKQPSFAYLHFYHVHDWAFSYPELMSPTHYGKLVDEMAEEIETVWRALVTDDDVVVIASDHGCRLREENDSTWRFYDEDEPTAGTFVSEKTVRGVCSLVSPGLFPKKKIATLVRSIDVFPTLCEALGLEYPNVQGCSLWSSIEGREAFSRRHAFIETGGVRMADGGAICRSVRTERWKYILDQIYGEQLYDLQEDPTEQRNLIGLADPQEKSMRMLFRKQSEENKRGVGYFYQPTDCLCEMIRPEKPLMPAARSGGRGISFQRLVDGNVLEYLKKHLTEYLNIWQANGERVVVYSLSEHSRNIVSLTEPSQRKPIVGFIDSNPDLAGKVFCGYPVYSLQNFEKVAQPTMVVVAHHVYAKDIYAQIKDNCCNPLPVFNLYHLDKEIPLWWDRETLAGTDS